LNIKPVEKQESKNTIVDVSALENEIVMYKQIVSELEVKLKATEDENLTLRDELEQIKIKFNL